MTPEIKNWSAEKHAVEQTKLFARIANLAKLKLKGNELELAAEQKKTADPYLPPWPIGVRGVPNIVLRSALFTAIKKGARKFIERQEIHSQEGIRVVYTGAQLAQSDLDVWETLVHLVRFQQLGGECRVTAYQLLKAMGKTDTGKNRDILERSLSRMKATALDVKVNLGNSYEGSLVEEVYRADGSRAYVILLNQKLHSLFAADQFTQVDWNVRQALAGQPLAQWLHGFYASHAKPFPIKIETIHALCGSECVEMWKFSQTLRKALDAVSVASRVNMQIFKFEIQDGLVHIQKSPSKSQKRHLARRHHAL